jgi:hypothetical protein
MSDIDFNELVVWSISKEAAIRNQQYHYGDFSKERMLIIIGEHRGFLEEKLMGKGMLKYDRRNIWEAVYQWYIHQKTEALFWREGKGPPKLSNQPEEKGKCTWPGCEIDDDEHLQADHIIPKSVLSLTDFKAFGGRNWEDNGQWLCAFHNRLKTDSIMLGLAMLCFK